MRVLILLAALIFSVPALASAATPGDLADRFIAAWNAHDPQAFDKLYTTDAVWVPIAEERTEGRAAIVSEFAKVHTGGGWAGYTTIAKKEAPEVHMLRPDVATVFFHMDFLLKDGTPVPGLQRAMILVATASDGNWKISAGQLTKESAASTK